MTREILTDMTNSIAGIITLGLWGISALLTFCYVLERILCKKRCRNKCFRVIKDKLKVTHKPCGNCALGALVVSVAFFARFLLADWRVVHENYIYIQTEMAKQSDVEILFLKEIDHTWEMTEHLQKLHVSKDMPIQEITNAGIDARLDEFREIYETGNKEPESMSDPDQEILNRVNMTERELGEMNPVTLDEYKKEFEAWDILYQVYRKPVYCYQSSRSARDTVEIGRSMMQNEELLKMAATAVYRGEKFLEYDDRNVNTVEMPIIIGTRDMAFFHGKLYYQLYDEAKDRDQLMIYAKDFLVNGYVCMIVAEQELLNEEVPDEDHDFAKINYYLGNMGEKILSEISKEDDFYNQMAERALLHYKLAWDSLEKNPDYYNHENKMKDNIKAGIITLTTELNYGLEDYLKVE